MRIAPLTHGRALAAAVAAANSREATCDDNELSANERTIGFAIAAYLAEVEAATALVEVGQIWVTPGGVTREILKINPKTITYRETSRRGNDFVSHAKNMPAWIKATRAELKDRKSRI
jgi:hypothetical protein